MFGFNWWIEIRLTEKRKTARRGEEMDKEEKREGENKWEGKQEGDGEVKRDNSTSMNCFMF